LPSRAHVYVPVRALSPIYRALFKQELSAAGQLAQIEPHVWPIPWNVHRQATPQGATSCEDRAPYVFNVAISHRRIVGLKDRIVTFTYRKPGSSRPRTTRLDVLEFMRRFLPHVLPAGFMQVRHLGFMHANCRLQTDTIRQLITVQTGATLAPPRRPAPTPAQGTCPNCGAPLIVLSRVWPCHLASFDTG
jgi:Putative transposase